MKDGRTFRAFLRAWARATKNGSLQILLYAYSEQVGEGVLNVEEISLVLESGRSKVQGITYRLVDDRETSWEMTSAKGFAQIFIEAMCRRVYQEKGNRSERRALRILVQKYFPDELANEQSRRRENLFHECFSDGVFTCISKDFSSNWVGREK